MRLSHELQVKRYFHVLQITPPPHGLLRDWINRTDHFAAQTVQAGQGGPFGASIHIYDPITGKVEQIGELAANAVLAKGMSSAHAENEVISPENVQELKNRLKSYDKNTVQVILSSSGQSCPACTAKEEILARHLIEKRLIKPKNFFVTYGATYQDTKDIAQFDDAPYKEDLSVPLGEGKVKLRDIRIRQAPRRIHRIFREAADPVAVVWHKGQVLGIGYDIRKQSRDLIATAEVSAMRAASLALKVQGKEGSWNLTGSSLYTSQIDIGALLYAESQWANIGTIVRVEHDKSFRFQTRESPQISNNRLFNIVASPNETASNVVSVIRIEPFSNLAQHVWRDRLNAQEDPSKILYNGIK